VIPLLQEIQAHYGYLDEKVMRKASSSLGIPLSDLYGVATFYSQFSLEKTGLYIVRVCHGTACHVNGARDITEAIREKLGIEEDETTGDGRFTLKTVACLGACSLSPAMIINDTVYGRLTKKKVTQIITRLMEENNKKILKK
jgi:NADH-quinone oxidoreductase subunit E